MINTKKSLASKLGRFSGALVLCLGLSADLLAGYVYVGSWKVSDGPDFWDNPAVLSGRETAALLFGGSPSDYAISTVSDQVADINFRAWLDGWGDPSTYGPGSAGAPQDYKLDTGAPGYNDPFGGPSYSAFVSDHFPYAPWAGRDINYAFRDDGLGVPEAGGTLALLGFALVGGTAFRRRFTTEA